MYTHRPSTRTNTHGNCNADSMTGVRTCVVWTNNGTGETPLRLSLVLGYSGSHNEWRCK